MVHTLANVFLGALYVTATLILLVVIYAIVTAPFKSAKAKRETEEFKKNMADFLNDIVEEAVEELKEEQKEEKPKKKSTRNTKKKTEKEAN